MGLTKKIRIKSQKDRRLQGIDVSKLNKQPNLQRKAWTKIFPPIRSQSKQILIFSFVTILSAYGFFCRLPFGALYACLKTINILFGLQWGRQKCKMFIGRLRNMISGWVNVHLLMNISEFTQCPKMAYNALAMNHYTASVSLSTYCNCCCFRQKHSFISPTPFPDFWINLWEEIIYCMV